jgi:desulfoferrodoxin-like iron-binding protein
VQREKMANQLGKVYICGKCGSQVIVTKGGGGELKCCGDAMGQKK